MFTLNNLVFLFLCFFFLSVWIEISGVSQESIGIFNPLKKKSPWPVLRKALRLVTPREQVKLENPEDINFIFGGYAPLAVRLVELANTTVLQSFIHCSFAFVNIFLSGMEAI